MIIQNSNSQSVKATFIHTGKSVCYPSCGGDNGGGGDGKFDYGDALGKTILFFEAQRSGKLPSNNRLKLLIVKTTDIYVNKKVNCNEMASLFNLRSNLSTKNFGR